jgi:hypothetical protein
MFYQLLFIHLYRPFLKYTKSTSPLPQHVSPRKLCSQAAAAISKLLRIYKRSYGLRQICNIAVYIVHSACTIHLLNLPERNAKRDLIHGVRNLEEIAEGWLCARRTLRVLDVSANKWHIELPSEVVAVFERTHSKWGSWGSWDSETSPESLADTPMDKSSLAPADTQRRPTQQQQQRQAVLPNDQAPYHHPKGGTFQQPAFFPNVPQIQSTNDGRSFNNFNAHIQVSLPNQQNYLTVSQGYPSLNAVPTSMSSDTRWNPNNHQDASCNNSNSSNSPVAVIGTPPMPVFNGLPEHLMEENQDWWLRDQSALALGLENWGEGWAGNQFVDVTGVSAAQQRTDNPMTSVSMAGNQNNGRPSGPSRAQGDARSNFNG